MKDLAQISLPAYGDYFASPMLILISEVEKNKCKKTLTCFLLTYATAANCCARYCDLSYNDKGGRKKKDSYGRY
jgi:hypothetical protein